MILEVKAVSDLTDEHRAQVHNYLKATGYRLGLARQLRSSRQIAVRGTLCGDLTAVSLIRQIRQIRGSSLTIGMGPP